MWGVLLKSGQVDLDGTLGNILWLVKQRGVSFFELEWNFGPNSVVFFLLEVQL